MIGSRVHPRRTFEHQLLLVDITVVLGGGIRSDLFGEEEVDGAHTLLGRSLAALLGGGSNRRSATRFLEAVLLVLGDEPPRGVEMRR